MQNPILNSEGFERASYTLQRALENFGTGDFDQSCRMFERSVDKLGRILGMQAANDQRKAIGDTMLYTESDFLNA